MKLLGVGFDILAPVEVRFLSMSGEYDYTYRPYFDATAPSLSIHCGVLGNTCCICLPAWINSYAISLACLSAMSKQASSSIANNMHTYVDTFYGSYKDGTEPGSRDCRWLASLFFCLLHFYTGSIWILSEYNIFHHWIYGATGIVHFIHGCAALQEE